MSKNTEKRSNYFHSRNDNEAKLYNDISDGKKKRRKNEKKKFARETG